MNVKPERWKIYNVEENPEKDFWNEIRHTSELQDKNYSHLPDTLAEIKISDKYEIERLWSDSKINAIIGSFLTDIAEDEENVTDNMYAGALRLKEDLEKFFDGDNDE